LPKDTNDGDRKEKQQEAGQNVLKNNFWFVNLYRYDCDIIMMKCTAGMKPARKWREIQVLVTKWGHYEDIGCVWEVKVKVKQFRYRTGVAQRVPRS
jgi:hypothetical protein